MNLLRTALFTLFIVAVAGCVSSPVTSGQPVSFDSSFDDIDVSEDGSVSTEEFAQAFPDACAGVFESADADNDHQIYPDEWYQFRERKGYIKQ